MGEDRLLDTAQLRARVQTGLLGQDLAGTLVGGQRLGLPASAIEGAHQQRLRPLPQRLLGDQRLQLPHQPGMLTQGQLRRDAILQRAQAQLLKTSRVGDRERLPSDVGQRRTPPQVEPTAERDDRLPVPPGDQVRVPFGGKALKAQRVHLVRRHRHQVAGRSGHQLPAGSRRLQRPPQPRHQRLQGVRRVGRQARLLPQQVDQPLGRHHPPRLQRQHGDQESQPPAGHLDHAALALDLQRSQQADLHLAVTLPPPPASRSTSHPPKHKASDTGSASRVGERPAYGRVGDVV